VKEDNVRKFFWTFALATSMASTQAIAHAHLEKTTPAAGSTVKAAKTLTLTFSQRLEPAFSGAEVEDTTGKRVDKGATVSNTTITVELGLLAAGTYRVKWHVLSVDTHKTEGNYTFTVAP
jgi:methionine-rich copper-binding protein CopC